MLPGVPSCTPDVTQSTKHKYSFSVYAPGNKAVGRDRFYRCYQECLHALLMLHKAQNTNTPSLYVYAPGNKAVGRDRFYRCYTKHNTKLEASRQTKRVDLISSPNRKFNHMATETSTTHHQRYRDNKDTQ